MSNDEYDYSDSQSFGDMEDNMSVDSAPYFENNREENYSENSSILYNGMGVYTDPTSKTRKYVRRVDPSTGKWVHVYVYPTNSTPNRIIRHAMSGSFQQNNKRPCRVSTRDEDLFFSTIIATGELGYDGNNLLFYDSPEQYEQHLFTTVSREVKTAWRQRRDAAVRRAMNESGPRENVVVK